MAEREKSFMVVERCLIPPDAHKKELIYCGKEIILAEIPEKLSLDKKTAKNYYYSVSKVGIKDNKLFISRGVFDYSEILSGTGKYDNPGFGGLELSLAEPIKEKIVDLLSNAD